MELKHKSVLVTGGAGFIGSSLVRELEKKENEVVVIDNLVAGSLEHLEGTKANFIKGDIRNEELLNHIMERNSIEYCFHLAAEPYIPKGYGNPELMFQINTLGTISVLKACKENKVKKIINYSTSEIYGTAQYTPMDESHPINPHSIYATSKLAAERACYILWKEQQIPVTILRQFNCYGEREGQPYIIPEIISQFTHKGNILHLGNIMAKRDFTYVGDASKASILLMETDNTEGLAVNYGRGETIAVKDIAKVIANQMGIKNWGVEIQSNRLRPFDVNVLQCDTTYFDQLTGGLEHIPFEEGIKRTVEYYIEHDCKWSWEN